MTQRLYPCTAEKAESLRALLRTAGVRGARVRVMPNGAGRLVLRDRSDRDRAVVALARADALTASGRTFTDPDSRYAWNGPVEIFVRFAAP